MKILVLLFVTTLTQKCTELQETVTFETQTCCKKLEFSRILPSGTIDKDVVDTWKNEKQALFNDTSFQFIHSKAANIYGEAVYIRSDEKFVLFYGPQSSSDYDKSSYDFVGWWVRIINEGDSIDKIVNGTVVNSFARFYSQDIDRSFEKVTQKCLSDVSNQTWEVISENELLYKKLPTGFLSVDCIGNETETITFETKTTSEVEITCETPENRYGISDEIIKEFDDALLNLRGNFTGFEPLPNEAIYYAIIYQFVGMLVLVSVWLWPFFVSQTNDFFLIRSVYCSFDKIKI